jgi:hypothetical protein
MSGLIMGTKARMRILVATISLLGVLVFGSAWIASWVSPTFVESIGRQTVRIEVQRQASPTSDTLASRSACSPTSHSTARGLRRCW